MGLQLADKQREVEEAIANNKGVVSTDQEAHAFMTECLTSLHRHFENLANARYDFDSSVDQQEALRLAPRLDELAAQHVEKV